MLRTEWSVVKSHPNRKQRPLNKRIFQERSVSTLARFVLSNVTAMVAELTRAVLSPGFFFFIFLFFFIEQTASRKLYLFPLSADIKGIRNIM
jgi:hypothetical protein